MSVGAVLWEPGTPWDVTEVQVDEPRAGEVLVRYEAAGVCHSDEHVRTGEQVVRYPVVGGHEGAGVVEAVGPGVTRVAVGDHVVCTFAPACGHCYWCLSDARHLCTTNSDDGTGSMPDGTYRRRARGQELGGYDGLGAFARHGVVVENACIPIADDIPFEVACIVSCAVPTGWGAVVNAGGVRLGDTVVVYGVGGVGLSALMGARLAAARHVIAVDRVEAKRDLAMKYGATHFTTSSQEADDAARDATDGRGADAAVLATGSVSAAIISEAFSVVRRRGTVVLVGVGAPGDNTVQLPGFQVAVDEKRLVGTLYGSCNPHLDIPRLLELDRKDDLDLMSLVTHSCSLTDINDVYHQLVEGRILGRAVMTLSTGADHAI